MKFLCVDCDEPMKFLGSDGPLEGSLTVKFGCAQCGHQVAMLTNPLETQMVRSLGVKIGGRTVPAEPFEQLRSTLASQRADLFEGAPIPGEVSTDPRPEGPGCPFAQMITSQDEGSTALEIRWGHEAEQRIERIPSFIRPMAKKAIERYALGKGYELITESVMDEARQALGM